MGRRVRMFTRDADHGVIRPLYSGLPRKGSKTTVDEKQEEAHTCFSWSRINEIHRDFWKKKSPQ